VAITLLAVAEFVTLDAATEVVVDCATTETCAGDCCGVSGVVSVSCDASCRAASCFSRRTLKFSNSPFAASNFCEICFLVSSICFCSEANSTLLFSNSLI
jgi:hypothetical protein